MKHNNAHFGIQATQGIMPHESEPRHDHGDARAVFPSSHPLQIASGGLVPNLSNTPAQK